MDKIQKYEYYFSSEGGQNRFSSYLEKQSEDGWFVYQIIPHFYNDFTSEITDACHIIFNKTTNK